MGEGVAMRHTLIRRVEDAEELGPREGGPLGGEGLDPSPRALEARTTHKSTSRRCSRIWDPFGSQTDARRIEHLLVERRSEVLALPSIPHAAGDRGRWEPAHRARRYRATRSDQPATPRHPRTHYSPSARQLQLHAQAAHGGWWVIRYTHFAWCIFSAGRQAVRQTDSRFCPSCSNPM